MYTIDEDKVREFIRSILPEEVNPDGYKHGIMVAIEIVDLFMKPDIVDRFTSPIENYTKVRDIMNIGLNAVREELISRINPESDE